MTARATLIGFVAGTAVTALISAWFNNHNNNNNETARKRQSKDGNNNSNLRSPLLGGLRKRSFQSSSSFITDILRELWDYFNVAGADMIRETVEPYFKDLPGPLKTLRFTKIDLGTNPIQMDNCIVREIQDGMVQIDMDMIWNGNCDIQLQADYIGSFGVRELKLSGKFCLWLKPLTNELPVISGIQYAFVNPPQIELDFTGLAQVADFAVIDKAVRASISASLLSVVLPNKSLYKMQTNNNFLDTYQPPVGVCQVTALHGRGFIIEKKLIGRNDVPDVYLDITVGASKPYRTRTIRDNLNPVWEEAKDFILHDRGQLLTIRAWDEDGGPLDPDDDLGIASALVEDVLMENKRQLEMELLTTKTGKSTGAFVTMACHICPWTTDLGSLSSIKPNEVGGLLVIIVNRGFNIPVERKSAASFVKATYAGKEFVSNQVVDYPGYDALNPAYDSAFEVPLTADMPTTDDTSITFQLMNGTAPNCKMLGKITIDFDKIKKAPNHTISEMKSIGDGGASLEYRISLCGVERKSTQSRVSHIRAALGASPSKKLPYNSGESNGHARSLDLDESEGPIIGKVWITVVKGRGLTIQEELFNIDVPDAYCKIQFGSSPHVWTTSVQRNSCVPEWNESRDFPLSDHGQIITLDVYDKNEREYDPDVEIGSAKVTVGKLLLAGGAMDVELKRNGRPTGVFITLRCDLFES